MAFLDAGFLDLLYSWLLSPFIWIVLIFLAVGGVFGILWIRKRRKLIYDCIEIVDYGKGKAGINQLECGWFGKTKVLGGLFDYGDEQLETDVGEKILNFSTEDFKEFNGKRAIVVVRDKNNPEILAPIGDIKIIGDEMLAEIAPAEYRDAALDILHDVEKETSDYTKRIVEWVIIGVIIIFALVSIIVIAQMVKHGQTEAGNLIIEAAKIKCSQAVTTLPSTAP